jgi:hypothetical protein
MVKIIDRGQCHRPIWSHFFPLLEHVFGDLGSMFGDGWGRGLPISNAMVNTFKSTTCLRSTTWSRLCMVHVQVQVKAIIKAVVGYIMW